MSVVAKRLGPRGRLAAVVGAVVVLAALAAGGYAWLRYTTPAPPEVALDGVEPAVAQAIEAAQAKVRQNGRSAGAWGELGQVLIAHEFDAPADVCFAQAERLDAGQPRWPYYRGLSRTTQDPKAALPFLRRAADLCERHDRGNDVPRLLLAETLLQIGADDDAQAQLDAVLSWDPDNPRVHYDLGMLALARQDDEAAARRLTASAASPQARRKSCVALAAIRERQGDAAGAAEYARQAAALPQDRDWDDPYTEEYLTRQVAGARRFIEADQLESAGRLADALAVFRELAQDASDANAQVRTGAVLLKLHRLDEAERFFRAAIGLKTHQTEANYFLALTLYKQGEEIERRQGSNSAEARAKYQEALAFANRAVELKPNYVLAQLYRGLVLKHLGRKQEALEAFREAARYGAEQVEPHLKLGEALAEDGRRDEAIAELKRAADVAPADDSRPREALAKALASSERPK